jgi:hypothetical protein
MHRRPERGKPPAYIHEKAANIIKATSINNQLRDAYSRAPQRAKGLISQFLAEFLLTLKQFEYQEKEGKSLDEIVYDIIHDMLPLKNEFIGFVEAICDNQEHFPADSFISFFEEFHAFTQPNVNTGYYIYEEHFDQFKFSIRESFLFLIIILLDKRRYDEIAKMTGISYFVGKDGTPKTFTEFCEHTRSLDVLRRDRLQNRKYSNNAEILITERATERYHKSKIVEADLLLYHLSKKFSTDEYERWYPYTYIYRRGENLRFFTRMQSENFANEGIKIFKCLTIQELKSYIETQNEIERGYGNMSDNIPRLRDLIPPDKLATSN